jgi:hypothetical protein
MMERFEPAIKERAGTGLTPAIAWATRSSAERCPCQSFPATWEDHRSLPRHENPGRPYSAGSGVKNPMTEDGPVVVPSSVIPSSPVGAAPYSPTGTIREAAAAGTREPSAVVSRPRQKGDAA